MDVKYQIFVSSTYADLVDERRSVIEAVLNLGPRGVPAAEKPIEIHRALDQREHLAVPMIVPAQSTNAMASRAGG
jgi:hypothetical protein